MTGSCGTLFDTPDKPREISGITKAVGKCEGCWSQSSKVLSFVTRGRKSRLRIRR